MNTFVLHTTLVCLVIIAGGVKCKISDFTSNKNDLQHDSNAYVIDSAVNTVQHEENYYSNEKKNSTAEQLQYKCKKNSQRANAFEELIQEIKGFYLCLQSHNITELFKNIVKRDSSTPLDSLIKKFCKKLPAWHACTQNYIFLLKECLYSDEKINLNVSQNVSNAIESFFCQNDGEHITEMFSNGGESCFKARNSTIQECLTTLSNKDYFPKTKPNHKVGFEDYLTHFKFNEVQCNDLRELKFCIVNDLKHCEQQTTANLIGTVIELALQRTPCSKFTTPVAE